MRIASCAISKALIKSASEHSFASPSTIIRFFSVAAIMNSKSDCASSERVGFTKNCPLTRAIRTSEIISFTGISDTASAADAAKQASESGNTSASLEIKLTSTCTSHK